MQGDTVQLKYYLLYKVLKYIVCFGLHKNKHVENVNCVPAMTLNFYSMFMIHTYLYSIRVKSLRPSPVMVMCDSNCSAIDAKYYVKSYIQFSN